MTQHKDNEYTSPTTVFIFEIEEKESYSLKRLNYRKDENHRHFDRGAILSCVPVTKEIPNSAIESLCQSLFSKASKSNTEKSIRDRDYHCLINLPAL